MKTQIQLELEHYKQEGYSFIAPNFKTSGSGFDWFDCAIKHDSWVRNYGLKEEGRLALGLPEFPYKPTLLADPTTKRVMLLHEYHTQDKGKIPVWPFDLYLPPNFVKATLLSASDMLVGTKIVLVNAGRTDCVVDLVSLPNMCRNFADGMSNRVSASWKRAFDTCLPRSTEQSWGQTSDFLRTCEYHDLVRHTAAQFISNTTKLCVSSADLLGHVVDDFLTLVLQSGISYKVFTTYFGDTLIAHTYILMGGNGEWYWLGSSFNRSPEADILCGSRINRVTATLVSLMGCAIDQGCNAFNLGINTFPYKMDFRPRLVQSLGLEYRGHNVTNN